MIHLESVSKRYPGGGQALQDIDLSVAPGEFVAVIGSSGAGKSTLLRCINRLVEPDSGRVWIAGAEVTAADGRTLRHLRRQIGMVFQEFHLVRRVSVLRNVLAGRLGYVPLWRSALGLFPAADRALATECLDRLGLAALADRRADTLSGGQQQRVAIARALAQQPRLLLADEPVASLDLPTAHLVMQDLQRIHHELGLTLLVNLHAVDLARQYATRVVGLRDGRIVFDASAAALTATALQDIYQDSSYPNNGGALWADSVDNPRANSGGSRCAND